MTWIEQKHLASNNRLNWSDNVLRLILLHGWGQNAIRWADRIGMTEAASQAGIDLRLPQSPRRWGWRAGDEERLEGVRGAVVGGFSDGARVALRAMDRYAASGLIFHSGLWRERDLASLNYVVDYVDQTDILIIDGQHDPTRLIPYWGTDAAGLAKRIGDVDRYTHPGGHEWGRGTTDLVCQWVASLGLSQTPLTPCTE